MIRDEVREREEKSNTCRVVGEWAAGPDVVHHVVFRELFDIKRLVPLAALGADKGDHMECAQGQ